MSLSGNLWPSVASRQAAIASGPRREPWVWLGGCVKLRQGRRKMEPAGPPRFCRPCRGLVAHPPAAPRLKPWSTIRRTSGAETALHGVFRQALRESPRPFSHSRGVRPTKGQGGREPEILASHPEAEDEACHAPGADIETRAMRQNLQLTIEPSGSGGRYCAATTQQHEHFRGSISRPAGS